MKVILPGLVSQTQLQVLKVEKTLTLIFPSQNYVHVMYKTLCCDLY